MLLTDDNQIWFRPAVFPVRRSSNGYLRRNDRNANIWYMYPLHGGHAPWVEYISNPRNPHIPPHYWDSLRWVDMSFELRFGIGPNKTPVTYDTGVTMPTADPGSH